MATYSKRKLRQAYDAFVRSCEARDEKMSYEKLRDILRDKYADDIGRMPSRSAIANWLNPDIPAKPDVDCARVFAILFKKRWSWFWE